MKLIFLTLLLTFSLTNCFLRAPDVKELLDKQSPSDSLQAFWVGFFGRFGLASPTQLLSCFNNHTAVLFFAHLNEVNALVQDAERRNTILVHLDFVKLLALHKGLESTLACVNQTQDYLDVLSALGIERNDPQLFDIGRYIFYQANFGKLAREFPPIIGAIHNGSFACAGDLHAALVNCTVKEIQRTGFHVQILKGLWNGVHIALGLNDSHSVLKCWDNQTALIRLEFIYGLSHNVSNGSASDAAYNTELWYNETGNALISQIPKSAWQCWGNSTDTQEESQALNISLTSDAFHQKIAQFVHSHQGPYWHFQKAISDGFDQLNFLHAGNAYGHLLQAAVNSN